MSAAQKLMEKEPEDKEDMGVKVEMGRDKSTVDTVKGVAAALLYGGASMSCAFSSKLVMDTMKFDFPITLLTAQMIFTIFVLNTLKVVRSIDLPAYTLKRGWSFAAPAFFYGFNAVLALTALSHMNIVMYDIVKRCVPLSITLLSVCVLGQGMPSRGTLGAVLLLTAGCVMGGYGDLAFDFKSYACGITSNFTQALYLLLVQRQTEQKSVVETLQLNSVNTLPLLAAAAVLTGELRAAAAFPRLSDPWFCAAFTLAVSAGMLLNYSLFLCTHLTSALTTSIVGGFKALAQTLLGIIFFGGLSRNVSTVAGLSLNLTGAVAYIVVRYRENVNKASNSLPK